MFTKIKNFLRFNTTKGDGGSSFIQPALVITNVEHETPDTIHQTSTGWYLNANGKTYSRRRDAVRGFNRLMAA